MISPKSAAFLIIDMHNGFIDADSALCVAGAEATLPACSRSLDHARKIEMPVFYIHRNYAEDGSNVEAVRYRAWKLGGRPLSSAINGSIDFPGIIAPKPGDHIICKPRFSSFFNTDLDSRLHDLGVGTLVVCGTTTPNCIRATCLDGLSLGYNVVVIEDCTSSRTTQVQAANIDDFISVGIQVIDAETFCNSGIDSIRDIEAEYRFDLAGP